MGQPIAVVKKQSPRADVVRFEINRSLTGMGHERYRSRDDAIGKRPVDELVRRLFDRGGIDAVHVNSSVITVDLAGGSTGEGLLEVIEDLFRFYDPSATPDVATPDAAAPDVATPDAGSGPVADASQ